MKKTFTILIILLVLTMAFAFSANAAKYLDQPGAVNIQPLEPREVVDNPQTSIEKLMYSLDKLDEAEEVYREADAVYEEIVSNWNHYNSLVSDSTQRSIIKEINDLDEELYDNAQKILSSTEITDTDDYDQMVDEAEELLDDMEDFLDHMEDMKKELVDEMKQAEEEYTQEQALEELKEQGCSIEQDCIDLGECSGDIECTCLENECNEGYVALPEEEPEEVVPAEPETICKGCLSDESCVDFGFRLTDESEDSVYCNLAGELVEQKQNDEACQNDFECLTNSCLSGNCEDLEAQLEETQTMFQKIRNWFSRLFGN
jgi:tetratricopeptide (TPR) repeat protein